MTITVVLICFRPPQNFFFLGGGGLSAHHLTAAPRFLSPAGLLSPPSPPASLSFTLPTRDLCFSLVAFACQQKSAAFNGWLSTNIGGTMGNGPGKNPLNWYMDTILPVQFLTGQALFSGGIWGSCWCKHLYGCWIIPQYKHLSIEHLWNLNTCQRTRQNVRQRTTVGILTTFTAKYCYPVSPLLLPTMPEENISFLLDAWLY